MSSPAVCVRNLTFRYRGDDRAVLDDVSLTVPRGARCLLVGANGAGKSTLLSVLAGRHLVSEDAVRVLDRPAFHDTSLVHRVGFLGGTFPFHVDLRVGEVLDGTRARRPVDEARLARLLSVLGIDLSWRMNRVSDGQRRRVQILLGLLEPKEVLLLDEVTTDLDVLARMDLLELLREETETRGLTLVYATHIFDALDRLGTHLAWLDRGRVRCFGPMDSIPELVARRTDGDPAPLLRTVEAWLRLAC